jgi:NAD(P)-dependent dehydrogenase (short-subunit alcohol dehydrogenase family)
MRIEGTAALVTGAASGLGQATAHALKEAGAHVVALDLPGTRDAVLDAGLAFAPGDVCDTEAVEAAVAAAAEAAPLRIVVNCAGVGDPARVLRRGEPLDLAAFRRVIEINLVGTFNVVRLAAARIARAEPLDGERGVIVNTASVAAFDGQVGQAAYAASKGGVASLTLPLARDLAASLVRVVTIAPGLFDTSMLATLPEPIRASLAATVPHPARLGQAHEYAALALHAIENQMLNGETIRLDGAVRLAAR